MADTSRGSYPDQPCSDCKKTGQVCIKHWGPLVPPGEVGAFDEDCWEARVKDGREGKPPRPLGTR